MVRRGQIRWLLFDDAKARPGVVLTRDAVAGRLRSVMVAPVTSTIRDLPSEVRLGAEHGMPKACVINLDNVSLVDRSVLGEVLTQLDASMMRAVCDALAAAVGCSPDF